MRERRSGRLCMVIQAGFVALAVFAVLALLWGFQRRLIYLPFPAAVSAPAEVLSCAREVTLRTSDGLTLGGWFVPAGQPDRATAVLVANGNAGDRAGRLPFAQALAARGFTVLLFDYRGYGGNPGSPSEAGLYRDVRAAYAHLVTLFPPERIVLFGESLGAAVVTDLAAESPVASLVLRSPFTDLPSVGARHYPFLPVRLLLRDRFPLIQTMSRVPIPVTVIYGSVDSVVPPSQSREVAASAPHLAAVVEVRGADHNDEALFTGAQLIDAITAAAPAP